MCERLIKVVPLPYAWINRSDARRLGLEKGDLVELKIRARQRAGARSRSARMVTAGTRWLPRRLREVRASALLQPGARCMFTAATITKLKDAAAVDGASRLTPSTRELRGDVDPAASIASGMPSATT